MYKSFLGLLIMVILVALGYGVYMKLFNFDPDQLSFLGENMAPFNGTPSAMQKAKVAVLDNNRQSRYIPHFKTVMNDPTPARRVLFFYANWCDTCRPADEDLRKNESRMPEDVRVIRVNFNDTDTDEDEKALAKQYQVPYQHTFVQIDAQGKVVTRWNGGQTDQLLEKLK